MRVKADLARQIGKHARPRIAVAALILQHAGRLFDLPAFLAGIDLTDTQIAEGLLGVVIDRAQLFHLGHVVSDHTRDCIRQQAVQFLGAGGVAAVAVEFEAVHRGVAVKLAVRIHMEQQAVNVVPALGKPGGLLIVAGPAFHAVRLVVLVVSGRLEHIQIRPVGIRHVRHHADALAGSCHRRVSRTAEHAVEDGHDLRAGDRLIRTEGAVCIIRRDPPLRQRSLYSAVRPVRRRHIGKGLLGTDIIMRETGQDRNKLCAGDGILRAEAPVLIAVYQRKAGHFTDRSRVPRVRRYVNERIIPAAGFLHQQAGQQLAGFGAGNGRVRAEGAVLVSIHILHVLSGVERRRTYRRLIPGLCCAGRDRHRACSDQRGKCRGSHLSFHCCFSPLIGCSARLDGISRRLVPL